MSTPPEPLPFQRVMVANRGEIARRVFRTCHDLGLTTVAVHTDADAHAPHVRDADEAVRVESYLDAGAVVAAALASGVDAVHPGYGFLSERAPFARAVAEAGITFVGPSADVMDLMGRKDAAREVAVAADVPVVPSYALEDDGVADPAALTYPVLVKAAAGGGGKGMRVVRSADALPEAMAAARREAASAFGDDTLLVETFVERGRHVEVQVLGDTHGRVVHLHERDCSPQRRHQKVLEEAPAPTLDATLRERICSAAVALAAEVGYVSAGTVEFLLDADTGAFYFLEMNTRLQVEHPVTEAVTGLDLVALQLRVAAGEPLDLDVVPVRGHAIEARVYAEDPYAGFLPQAGRAGLVRWPDHVRVDHALESGQEVGTAYDPMLGKVIATGPDRESARQALVAALDATAVLGLTTNVGYLRALVASDAFRDAAIDTAWLDRTALPSPDQEDARLLAAWTDVAVSRLDEGDPHPFGPDGWRLGADPAPVIVDLDRPVRVDTAAGTVDGVPVEALREPSDHTVMVTLDGVRHRAVVDADRHRVEVVHRGHRHVFERPDVMADHGPPGGDGTVSAPMPGTVLDVRVAEGDRVAEGAVLGALEAMKMELSLTAPFAGTVAAVGAAAGDGVALGATLFVVEAEEEA
jgi:acetyl-CoA/propionyl-CoA carboxylase biotin carboxyl carrier protein